MFMMGMMGSAVLTSPTGADCSCAAYIRFSATTKLLLLRNYAFWGRVGMGVGLAWMLSTLQQGSAPSLVLAAAASS
jgi:hypothetical protein